MSAANTHSLLSRPPLYLGTARWKKQAKYSNIRGTIDPANDRVYELQSRRVKGAYTSSLQMAYLTSPKHRTVVFP